ncbi:MAG: LysR family transcriptional regulator [Candidatus Howiella sp.]
MELLQLRYFVHAARTENFSRTAAFFMVPQSSVSQTIKKLEGELGAQLFARRGNRVFLNEKGRVFYDAVSASLAQIDAVCRDLREDSAEPEGELRLLVRTNRRIVTDCMVHFGQRYPKVNFSMMHAAGSAVLSDFDLIVAEESEQYRGFESSPLITEDILLAVSAAHPLASKKRVRMQEMKNERFIVMPKGSSLYELTEAGCRAAGFVPDIAIESDDPFYLRKYVGMNLGIALVPAFSWKGQFGDRVVLQPVEGVHMQRVTKVYWKGGRCPAAAERFRDFLLKACRAETAEE